MSKPFRLKPIRKIENSVPLNDEDFHLIVQGLDPDSVLFGGHALAVWARVLDIEMPEDERKLFQTKDADFIGDIGIIKKISKSWNAEPLWLPKESMSGLFGQVRKLVGPNQYKSLDVMHKAMGFEHGEIEKDSILLSFNGDDFKIHHPVGVLKARLVNVLKIPKKQNIHGAKQIEIAIKVVNQYLRHIDEDVEHLGPRKNGMFGLLKRVADLATDPLLQGTAKACDLDVSNAIPVELLKNREEYAPFMKHQWSRIVEIAENIQPRKDVVITNENMSNIVEVMSTKTSYLMKP